MFYPRVPLKKMDPAMLLLELDRETMTLSATDTKLVTSAVTMASFLHRDQTRMVRGNLPRVPYIEHPLRVALRLVRWGVRDASLIAAALLHDVVEDCAAELNETFGEAGQDATQTMFRLYGPQVASPVHEVTNPEACGSQTAIESYDEHITALAVDGSDHALLIKASDLKDNAGSIKHQLGNEHDKRLLRMVRKYYSAVKTVGNELAVRADDTTAGRRRYDFTAAQRKASEDLNLVFADLTEIAVKFDLDVK